jgi:hypothetical protein
VTPGTSADDNSSLEVRGPIVQMKAPAFKPGAVIPEQFTCDGSNYLARAGLNRAARRDSEFHVDHGRPGCARSDMGPLAAL